MTLREVRFYTDGEKSPVRMSDPTANKANSIIGSVQNPSRIAGSTRSSPEINSNPKATQMCDDSISHVISSIGTTEISKPQRLKVSIYSLERGLYFFNALSGKSIETCSRQNTEQLKVPRRWQRLPRLSRGINLGNRIYCYGPNFYLT